MLASEKWSLETRIEHVMHLKSIYELFNGTVGSDKEDYCGKM